MSASEIDRTLVRLAHEILEKTEDLHRLAFIGIRRRGVPLALRLADKIKSLENLAIPVGFLDINLYRDDLSTVSEKPVHNATEITFPVTGKDIILMDDVLYTGRTIRAALDALFDQGRPARVQLLGPNRSRLARTPHRSPLCGPHGPDQRQRDHRGEAPGSGPERQGAAGRENLEQMPGGLLGIELLERAEIEGILDRAKRFQPRQTDSKKSDQLRGRMIVNLFFEASTRTRTSFEIAAKRLGADAISITASASSVSKGESLVDTLNTLGAMHPDAIVMRHAASGAPHFLARYLPTPIINAGDGTHEHPTQALLDARTILDRRPTLDGLRVAIIGDIAHSRVARSNMYLLSKFGAQIVLCGPASLLPPELAQLAPGISLTHKMEDAIRDADVIMMLRVQLERQHEAAFSANEYFQFYGLRLEHMGLAKPDAIVMHPGPINRGREISSEVADSQRSVILNQVENGIAVRMAVLERILGN